MPDEGRITLRRHAGLRAALHAGLHEARAWRTITGMIYFGKVVLSVWAVGMAWVAYKLIMGQVGVALTAIEAGRLGEAISQFAFVTVVFVGTAIACGLFVQVGILRE
jgi:hypothetical protein